MLKKLLAALMCITIAASFAACGEEKDSKKDKSDSKESSSTIEEADENSDSESAAEEEIENTPKHENNDTLGLIDILPSGDWRSHTIAVTGLEEMTIEEYAEQGGIESSIIEMILSFTADGVVTLTSNTGSDTGTYYIDAENVIMTDSTGADINFTYDETTGLLSLDMLGDGSMVMTFTVGQ